MGFEFTQHKSSKIIVRAVDQWNSTSDYFTEGTVSSNPQQVQGGSQDLIAKFNVDANLNKGQVVLYQRNTGLIAADFELRCTGTLQ